MKAAAVTVFLLHPVAVYGENMEEGIVVKSNAVDVLEKQLQARATKQQYGIVTVGSGDSAYMRHEKNLNSPRQF
jgi:DNA repair photolyase